MNKRRVKGEGSVYRRGDGRVVGEYEDANGKRRYVSGKTKAEVRRKLRKLLGDRNEGRYVEVDDYGEVRAIRQIHHVL